MASKVKNLVISWPLPVVMPSSYYKEFHIPELTTYFCGLVSLPKLSLVPGMPFISCYLPPSAQCVKPLLTMVVKQTNAHNAEFIVYLCKGEMVFSHSFSKQERLLIIYKYLKKHGLSSEICGSSELNLAIYCVTLWQIAWPLYASNFSSVEWLVGISCRRSVVIWKTLFIAWHSEASHWNESITDWLTFRSKGFSLIAWLKEVCWLKQADFDLIKYV